jgi:acid phosphatase (class A)
MKQNLIIFLLLAAGCASAQKNTLPEFVENYPGAPAIGSTEDVSDHDILLNLQKTRTAKECARAATEVKISLASYYGLPYGILTEKEVARLTPFFQEVSELAWPLIGQAKRKWKRVRPYDAHNDLHPCVSKETSFSYPSGHSAMSRYYYLILLNFYPDQKATLLMRSDQIATDRTIGGVHYPTDIRDGKILGEQIYEYLVKNSHLQEKIDQFKSTLKQPL